MGLEKVAELTGPKLNAAVAISLGGLITSWGKDGVAWVAGLAQMPGSVITCPNYVGCNGYYATDLIESEKVSALWDGKQWRAGAMVVKDVDLMYRLEGNYSTGSTKVEACLRHIIKSKMGESISL